MLRSRTSLQLLVALSSVPLGLVLSPPAVAQVPPPDAPDPPAAPAGTTNTVKVHTTEEDLEGDLLDRIRREALETSEKYGFEDAEITITIVWLEAENGYGIHVRMKTPKFELPTTDDLGPLFGTCALCMPDKVPGQSMEALKDAFDEYEKLKQASEEETDGGSRDGGEDPPGGGGGDGDPPPPPPPSPPSPPPALGPVGKTGVALIVLGSAAYVTGVALAAYFASEGPVVDPMFNIESSQTYTPGIVLLATAPIPIVAGAVMLTRDLKKRPQKRASAGLWPIRNGGGATALVRF